MKTYLIENFSSSLSLFRAVAYRAAGLTGASADDAVQTAMVKLIDSADRFDAKRGSARGFACSVVANAARNFLRDSHASQYDSGSVDDDGNTVEAVANLVSEDGRTVVESRSMIEMMHAAIAALPDDHCTFILAVMDDLTDKAAGELIGIGPVAALRLKRKIFAQLKEVLSA